MNIHALCFHIQTLRNGIIETNDMTMCKALKTCTIVFQKNRIKLSSYQSEFPWLSIFGTRVMQSLFTFVFLRLQMKLTLEL